MVDRYGSQVELEGLPVAPSSSSSSPQSSVSLSSSSTNVRPAPPSVSPAVAVSTEDEGESDDSDVPEPPPKPTRLSQSQSNVGGGNGDAGNLSSSPDQLVITERVPKLQLTSNQTSRSTSKSPRYASDPMKKTTIPDRNSGKRDSVSSIGGDAKPPEEEKKSLSKATGAFMSNVFRRTQSSMNVEEASSPSGDSEPPGDPSMFSSNQMDYDGVNIRSHSLMDAAESLKWRRQAVEGGHTITLTPINVTTVNKTNYYLVRVEGPDTSWVVPRTYEQFRDFRQNLLFEFPTSKVEAPPSKLFKGNVKEKTVGDRLAWLQGFLDSLLADKQLAGSVLLLKFLDPFYRPSPLALRAIGPLKEGQLQFRSEKTIGKALKPMLCILKHDLYVFRSIEDSLPFDVVALDFCTIDLLAESADVPRFAFQIVSLKEGETFVFAASSSKELADWILNLREEKTRRASFVLNENPLPYVSSEEASKKRVETTKLLSDYAFSREDDVSLSRRVKLPSNFLPEVKPDPEAGLSVDVKGSILAGTTVKLLHSVFDPKRCDKSFVSVFLVAFRYFSNPAEVFAYLLDKYDSGSVDIQARIGNVLERWLSIHLYDFLDSLDLTTYLVHFLLIKYDHKIFDLKSLLAKKLQPTAEVQASNVPQPILPAICRGSNFDLIDLAPIELARQITLVQQSLFLKVEVREFLQESWTGPEGPSRAPNLCSCIAFFNHLCDWVTTSIVSTRPPIPRIALIHKFIDVAKCCLDLQNFDATMAILGGLQSTPVHRLKEDWETVPKDSMTIFNEIKEVFVTTTNWKNYRPLIAACSPPAIPYIGLYLQDLTFFEANKDVKVIATMTMVNVEKTDKIYNLIIAEVLKFQAVPYVLKPTASIQNYILRAKVLSRGEQDAESLLRRPKNVAESGQSPRKIMWKKEFASPRRESAE